MARDFLAIQGSSVASERSFSSGGLTNTLNRNRIEPGVFGYCQILKNLYNTNFLSANMEAKAHEPMEWED
jgi:hAT family C-terminal dimerisation region